MQRKCNLSLYARKKRVRHCWHCKARLKDQTTLFAYCSDNCFKQSQQQSKFTRHPAKTKQRHAEIPTDEWYQAKEREEFEDDFLWARQAEFWQKEQKSRAKANTFRTHKFEPKPLILTGHGVRLRVDHGGLLVRNGFTHHPQKQEERRLFPGDANMPSRIVLLDTSGYLTLDVIEWISSQHVPLVLLNWKSEVTSICGGDGTQSDPRLRQSQLAAQRNGLGLKLSIQLIKDKLKNSQETLFTLPAVNHEQARRRIANIIRRLAQSKDMAELRFYEARAASTYFARWQGLELNWKGSSRSYVPPEWVRIGQRRSEFRGGNRHATHPVNAILNYAYAMLESQVHTAVLEAGLDPTVGYLHASRPDRLALVYDLMEPLRPLVDRFVLRFVFSHLFTSKEFLLGPTGICRLHPLLAKRASTLIPDWKSIEMVVRNCVQSLLPDYKPTWIRIGAGESNKQRF
jgi:CRISPR-associated protein Cas1